MPDALILLPTPRQLAMTSSSFTISGGKLILLQAAEAAGAFLCAQRLQAAIDERAHVHLEIAASGATPADLVAITLRILPKPHGHAQGYRISIASSGVVAEAQDEPGLFYAVCTLIQIIEQSGPALPCLEITDWPDFPARGIMLDVSRDKVPTLHTLFSLVDKLAGWKLNQLQLYTEHTFAYRNHPDVWAVYSPITGDDVQQLDRYCRQRYVELVPNQNSFGHVERWLMHPRYASLGEGVNPDNTLCPVNPDSITFVAGLFDELLPHFSSRMFNVGCDETEIGKGRSKEACAQRGEGRVYLDFLLAIYREVKKRGHTMQFWGDIIMRHPELIAELPKDVIALEWGYEANHPFAEHSARFAASGIPFYVCPGTSSWNTIGGRTENALGDLLSAAQNGLKNGAIGYLNTDWGDRGHWQWLPVSYLGYGAGAAYSWAVEANQGLDVAGAISLHAFGDATGAMGRVAYDLGNVYKAIATQTRNSTVLFRMLHMPVTSIVKTFPDLTASDLHGALAAIDQAMSPLSGAAMTSPDAALVRDEYLNAAHLMRHSCRRGLLALDPQGASAIDERRQLDMDMFAVIQEFVRLWLARNRQGGLADSMRRLEKARQDYVWAPGGEYPWW